MAKEKSQARKSLEKISKYKQVFGSNDGMDVLYDLMQTHHMLGSTFDGDTTKLIFREGERNVILRILKILKMDAKTLQERLEKHELASQ